MFINCEFFVLLVALWIISTCRFGGSDTNYHQLSVQLNALGWILWKLHEDFYSFFPAWGLHGFRAWCHFQVVWWFLPCDLDYFHAALMVQQHMPERSWPSAVYQYFVVALFKQLLQDLNLVDWSKTHGLLIAMVIVIRAVFDTILPDYPWLRISQRLYRSSGR